MRISDWSSDVCSSDLLVGLQRRAAVIDVGTVASEHRDQNRNQNQDRQIFFPRDIPPTHAGKASMLPLFRNPPPSHRPGDRPPTAFAFDLPPPHPQLGSAHV